MYSVFSKNAIASCNWKARISCAVLLIARLLPKYMGSEHKFRTFALKIMLRPDKIRNITHASGK